jgi:RHS repeat-associated protein
MQALNNKQKAHIYADAQPLVQWDGRPCDVGAEKYFYLHDRLGSVRKVVNTDHTAVAMYTYSPFGELIYDYGDYDQPLRFTAQYYDEEISQYHLRARTYDPHLSRFTSRDPILGKFEEPLTLHKYLYCGNDPVNRIDPTGEWAVSSGISIEVSGGHAGTTVTLQQFYGLSDDLTFFCGYMLTVGGGVAPGSLDVGGSVSYTMGYSPNAQSPEDLGGLFLETGGSAYAGFGSGGSWSVGPTTGVTMRNVSFGVGLGAGVRAAGLTHTTIFGDMTIGPSMHTRKRSPFEQFLTNRLNDLQGLYVPLY